MNNSRVILSFLLLAGTVRDLPAEVGPKQVRVAIVAEQELGSVVDVLTAELSQRDKVALLEREEIQRIYREQSLAAANGDHLKIGRILGADGLLLLTRVKEGTNQSVQVLLVAVQPGVIIGSVRSPWPEAAAAPWAQGIVNHFSALLPKLAVRAGDAVPISIVNLRSAVSSPKAEELELQLTLLLADRLTRQSEVFVLERRRMQLSAEEKDFAGSSETAFWTGSYLLEGVVDNGGYTKSNVTIDARLMAPHAKEPILLPANGPRTNLAEVINSLADKVIENLKLAKERRVAWDAAAEAAHYWQEAKWALKWQLTPQAQAAAESSWALGKHDLECASARVNAYLPDAAPNESIYLTGAHAAPAGIGPIPQGIIPKGAALITERRQIGQTQIEHYVSVLETPEPRSLDKALHLLSLYSDFSRTLPEGEPKAGSDWYQTGVEALTASARVLQHFHCVPSAQSAVADKLSELRERCRQVAAWLCASASVSNTYWFGERIASRQELDCLRKGENIFSCKSSYGAFWQETPEECLGLYRELMGSPAFCWVHDRLLLRELQTPRLAGWTEQQRQRMGVVWSNFIRELAASDNVLWRIEGEFFELADVQEEGRLEPAAEALLRLIVASSATFVTNHVELSYFGAETPLLIGQLLQRAVGGIESLAKERAENRLNSVFNPQLQAIAEQHRDFISKARQQMGAVLEVEEQKRYLNHNSPFDLSTFSRTFRFSQYSREQAAELQPLLANYKSNLAAQAALNAGATNWQTRAAIAQVGFVEDRVKRILNPPASPQARPASPASRRTSLPTNSTPSNTAGYGLLQVTQFFPLPEGRLDGTNCSHLAVFAQRVRDGRLWLDLRYDAHATNALQSSFRGAACGWDPANKSWEIISYPPSCVTNFDLPDFTRGFDLGLYFDIFEGEFYRSDLAGIQKLSSKTKQWERLKIPNQKLAQLFTVNRRLYAATDESIFEILQGGEQSRLLASCRRRPAASSLDSLDSLGRVILFPGPANSLRALIGQKIYSWSGTDWSEAIAIDPETRAEVSGDAVLLRSTPRSQQQAAKIWRLGLTATDAELCWLEHWKPAYAQPFVPSFNRSRQTPSPDPSTTWKTESEIWLASPPAAAANSNLYFFVEGGVVTNVAGHWAVAEKDGCHAELICLVRGSGQPLVLRLKFNEASGPIPGTALSQSKSTTALAPWQDKVWITVLSDWLLIGQSSLPGFWAISQADINEKVLSSSRKAAQK